MDEALGLLHILGFAAGMLILDKWQQKKRATETGNGIGQVESKKKETNKSGLLLNLVLIFFTIGAAILFFAGVVLLWWIWLPIMGFFLLLKLLAR